VFDFDFFLDKFLKNSRALYNDVTILIAKKNNAVDKVYILRKQIRGFKAKKAELKKDLLKALRNRQSTYKGTLTSFVTIASNSKLSKILNSKALSDKKEPMFKK